MIRFPPLDFLNEIRFVDRLPRDGRERSFRRSARRGRLVALAEKASGRAEDDGSAKGSERHGEWRQKRNQLFSESSSSFTRIDAAFSADIGSFERKTAAAGSFGETSEVMSSTTAGP